MGVFLHEFAFRASGSAVRGHQGDGGLSLPGLYKTVVGAVSVAWTLQLRPTFVPSAEDGPPELRLLSVELRLARGFERARLKLRAQAQLRPAGGAFPPLLSSSFVNADLAPAPAVGRSLRLQGSELLVEGTVLDGRVVLVVDTADFEPVYLVRARLDAVQPFNSPNYGPVVEGLFLRGLAGDAEFCDTLIVCAEGSFRAVSAILKWLSPYFRALSRFKASGAGGLVLDWSESGYSLAVVTVVFEVMHTFYVAPLEGWDLAELGKLLELADQLELGGLGGTLLHYSVELQILLSHDLEDAATLVALAAFTQLHGLAVLANTALVRIGAYDDAAALFKELGLEVPEATRERVAELLEDCVVGVPYTD